MNSLTKYELTFQQTTFHPVVHDNNAWLTSTELAQALGYADTKSVTKLFTRNSDEFTPAMSLVVEMTTNGINNSLRKKKVRVFSLRGAHLIAMFATTTVAKEFRRWVLDILDREVEQGNINPAFDFEMHARNMTVARKHFKFIYEAWCHQLDPALRAINSPVAAELVDHLKSLGSLTYGIHLGLERAEKSKLTH
ncbi:BRO-N domain-containing protein [Hafnia paralvei]|uniref:BRO-N domain-containing protein n=1 Tax=Hafnia paralvei TaxID=546367 RepID=UPI001033D77B|nr:BRO family protein [Hafnia paralvei]TBL62443.1 hypothetical protein EYY97_09135 [Hafnia paralvei]